MYFFYFFGGGGELTPDIFSTTLVITLYSFLNASHYFSHPHKTESHITLLFFSVFTSWVSEMQPPDLYLKKEQTTTEVIQLKMCVMLAIFQNDLTMPYIGENS
jgi:hypothetical protein